MQLRERNVADAGFAGDLDGGIERDQGLREIAGIGGDALLGGAEHRMGAIEAFQRGAAGSRIALVAIGVADVAEIAAAGALQDVAAERRHVAQLRAGGELERIGDHGIVALDLRIGGDIRHPRQRAEPQVSAVEHRSPTSCRPSGLMSTTRARPHHVELHQVDQRGSAGERLDRGFGQRVLAAAAAASACTADDASVAL